MTEAFAEIPPEPKQREETMEPNPADATHAKALRMENETDWGRATHVERINPSWGANGGWVPGTGIPHAYDAQMAAELAEAQALPVQEVEPEVAKAEPEPAAAGG